MKTSGAPRAHARRCGWPDPSTDPDDVGADRCADTCCAERGRGWARAPLVGEM